MIVIGVDPGTTATGFGVVQRIGSRYIALAQGDIRAPARLPMATRLARIHAALVEVIQAHQPDEAAVEDVFLARNPQTALKLGQARGVILLACAQQGIAVTDYSPTQVKRSVVGYGQADKDQVQFMIQRLLNLPTPPASEHAADALGIALCHLQEGRLSARTAGTPATTAKPVGTRR